MTANVSRFGPGTFKLGPTVTAIDFTCQVTSMTITVNKTEDDPMDTLCGDQVPGAISYTRALSGTFLQDLSTNGLNEYCETNAGTAVEFSYTPNNAKAAVATGTLVVDPIDFGSDSYGAPMDSDFEFSIVGKPTFVWAVTAVAESAQEPAA